MEFKRFGEYTLPTSKTGRTGRMRYTDPPWTVRSDRYIEKKKVGIRFGRIGKRSQKSRV